MVHPGEIDIFRISLSKTNTFNVKKCGYDWKDELAHYNIFIYIINIV